MNDEDKSIQDEISYHPQLRNIACRERYGIDCIDHSAGLDVNDGIDEKEDKKDEEKDEETDDDTDDVIDYAGGLSIDQVMVENQKKAVSCR